MGSSPAFGAQRSSVIRLGRVWEPFPASTRTSSSKNGEFGSLDWNADPVDDGRYRVTRPGTVTISKEFPNVSFRFRVRGNRISFTPLVRKGCQTFRCAWAISVAYPGSTWRRVG